MSTPFKNQSPIFANSCVIPAFALISLNFPFPQIPLKFLFPCLPHCCYKNSLGENPFLKGSSGYWRVRRGVVQGSPSRVGSKVQLPPHPLGVPISSASWSPKSSPLKKKPQGLPYCLCPGDHRVECKGVPGPVTLNMLRQMWKLYETQSCNLFIRTSSSV